MAASVRRSMAASQNAVGASRCRSPIIECNLNLDTCLCSRVLADLAPEHPEISIAELRPLGDSANCLEDWLNIHEYLAKVLRKFQGDIGVLQRSCGGYR